jgi:hypothetical protein
MRALHALPDGRLTTADILHKLIETLEQYAWMVSAESLKPASETRRRVASRDSGRSGEQGDREGSVLYLLLISAAKADLGVEHARLRVRGIVKRCVHNRNPGLVYRCARSIA